MNVIFIPSLFREDYFQKWQKLDLQCKLQSLLLASEALFSQIFMLIFQHFQFGTLLYVKYDQGWSVVR